MREWKESWAFGGGPQKDGVAEIEKSVGGTGVFFLVEARGQTEEWISVQPWKYLLVIQILTSGRQLEIQVWTLEELEM